ncbi:hypothetical protein [Vibrio sp. WXL103]|uniref:hypothetical protein n=1 Tax=Vibrio sp. WXL103 TaxID=3450710 RepID=UPI003EC943A4
MLKKNCIFILFLFLSVAYTYTDYHLSSSNKQIRVDKTAVNNYLHHTLEIVHPDAFENFQTGLDSAAQQTLIDNLITDQVLYEYGMRNSFADNDEDIKQIVIGKAQNDIEMKLLAEIDISPDQVYAHYIDNMTDYASGDKVTVELINLDEPSEKEITSALSAANNGQAAAEISTLANMPNIMRNADQQRLTLVFGAEIANMLIKQAQAEPLDQWQPGFTSKHGHHLYRISHYQESQPIPFSHVQQSIAQELLMNELRNAYDARMAEKRQAFKIIVDLEQGNQNAS